MIRPEQAQKPNQRTMTTFHPWSVIEKSQGKPTVRDSLTGVSAVSRTGSRTTKNRANNDMRMMRTAAKMPRDIIIQFVSPLLPESVKLRVHDETKKLLTGNVTSK